MQVTAVSRIEGEGEGKEGNEAGSTIQRSRHFVFASLNEVEPDSVGDV
jgi:hypothetical protein